MSNKNYEHIESLIEGGKSEDEIFTSLAKFADIGILAAVRVYKQFLKDTGKVMSADERKGLVADFVANNVIDGKIEISSIFQELADKLNVNAQTARSHIKRYCLANSIEVVVKDSVTEQDVADYTQFIIDGYNNNLTKQAIIESMLSDSINVRKASRIYARVAKESGFAAKRSKHDLNAIAQYVKDEVPLEISKKDFTENLCAKFNLPVSTARRLFNSWKFALIFKEL